MPPELIAVGQFVLGAGLLSAVAAYLFREYEQRQERRRELRGLLRLIDAEITRNSRTLNSFNKYPNTITSRQAGALKTRNWDDNRLRISQLMQSDDRFDTLYHYYHAVALLEELRLWEDPEEDRKVGFYGQIERMQGETARAQTAIRDELKQAGFDLKVADYREVSS